MSDKELVEVSLKRWNFSFYVARLPEDTVVEKLAIISMDTGLVSRIDYQNFVFSETIVNLERLFRFLLETTGGDREQTIKLRNDIEELIYSVNPAFDPNLLIITKNGVIKPATLGEGIPLTQNPDWGREVDEVNPFIVVEEVDIIEGPEDGDAVVLPPDEEMPPHIDTVHKKWARTGLILEIRKFSKEDLPFVFYKAPPLDTELLYKIHITRRSIVHSDQLWLLIGAMGLTEDVAQEDILEELYKLCISVNPILKFTEIDVGAIQKVLSNKKDSKGVKKRSKKPERKSDKSFSDVSKEELLTLSDRMKSKIIGQGEAVDQIVETIQIASCGLRNPEKPIAVYMLCGVTGVGKTLTAKTLAEELCGTREALVRVDCSEYTEQHSIQKLIGAPPSYVGYEDGGYLTNAVQEHPFAVVLFDEIEKAHNKMFDLLLQIMDDSRLTDGKGNVTSFKDCVILLTSNVGVSESEAVRGTMGFGDEGVLTEDRRKDALKKALKKRFRPEFLNRIDNTISFRSLNKKDAVEVVGLLLDKVVKYLEPKDVSVEFTDAVKTMVFEKGFSRKYGARPLERTIEREVIKPLAQMMLRDEIKAGGKFLVDFKKNEIVIKDLSVKKLKRAQAV